MWVSLMFIFYTRQAETGSRFCVPFSFLKQSKSTEDIICLPMREKRLVLQDLRMPDSWISAPGPESAYPQDPLAQAPGQHCSPVPIVSHRRAESQRMKQRARGCRHRLSHWTDRGRSQDLPSPEGMRQGRKGTRPHKHFENLLHSDQKPPCRFTPAVNGTVCFESGSLFFAGIHPTEGSSINVNTCASHTVPNWIPVSRTASP